MKEKLIKPAGQEKRIFFLGAQPGRQKFPADQQSIFVLNFMCINI
jgi:hypothetical protein